MDQKYCLQCDEPDIDKVPPCPLQCRSPQCKAYQKQSPFDPDTKPIIWMLGGPGSGKYTQCMKIVENYGFTHLSTGDILRDEVASGSNRAKCLTSIMERGGLVPNDLVLAVLKEAMVAAAFRGTRGYLVDGYPREKAQGMEFERAVGRVSLILYFEASTETLTKRLLERAKTSGRIDDNEETIKLRLATFLKHNQAIIDTYGDRVVTVSADRPPDAIFNEVRKAIDAVVARAAAIEAQNAELGALQKAKNVNEFARSSIAVARSAVGQNPSAKTEALISSAKEATASAQNELKKAHDAAEAAKAAAAAKSVEPAAPAQNELKKAHDAAEAGKAAAAAAKSVEPAAPAQNELKKANDAAESAKAAADKSVKPTADQNQPEKPK